MTEPMSDSPHQPLETKRPGLDRDSPPPIPYINVDFVPRQDDFTLLYRVSTPTEWESFLNRCVPASFVSRLRTLPASGNVGCAPTPKPEERRFSISETIQLCSEKGEPI